MLSEKMIEDWKDMTNIKKYVNKLSPNRAFIFAGNYKLFDTWKNYLSEFPVKVVPGATHRFVEEGVLLKLYDSTLELLNIKN